MQQQKASARLRPKSWVTRLLGAAGILAGMATVGDINATPASFTFVAPNPGWVTARLGGTPIGDVEGDTPGARDIVGDTANPMLYVASDATHLYFRLRLDADPLQNPTNFGPFGWGCLVDTNADPTTFEYSTIVDGVNNPDQIHFYRNTVTTTPNDPQEAPDMPPVVTTLDPLAVAVKHAQVSLAGSNFGGTPDYFMDWAIELAPALAAGYNPANPARYYCGSANNGSNLGADCSGGTICGTLSSQFSDPIACGALGCSVCGDGQKQGSEGCDDGNTTNGDGCNSVCLLELGRPCAGVSPACASGFCDPTGNICACDTSTDCPVGQLCATTPNPNICVNPGCGNTVLEGMEGCDDGNTMGGDGCSMVCLLELGQPCMASGVCESGFCDPAGNLCACDTTADCPMGQVCYTSPNPNLCVPAGCGNFVLEAGEGCDDGNTTNGDGCNSTCLREIGEPCVVSTVCASSFCDTANNTCACDQNSDCPVGQTCNLLPNPNQCVPAGCGDGSIMGAEGCDDGNLNNGDGCNAQCLKELGQPCSGNAVCASTFCDPAGNLCACDADADCPGVQLCNVTPNPNICVNPGCGNGVVEVTEACDDGNTTSGDGCNSTCFREIGQPCTLAGQCASSFCDPTNSACACDQSIDCPMGQLCNTVADPNICVMPGCGNNVLEAGEACEDGNTTNGDGCNALCLKELGQSCLLSGECASASCDPAAFICVCDQDADCSMGKLCNLVADPNICVDPGCGNNVLEAGEACEDGNTTNGDGCNSVCLRELGQSCMMGTQCGSAFCDAANNTCACDQDADCSGGQLCNLLSAPNTCVNPGCGNGVLEAGEACEDGNNVNGDGCNAVCLREIGQACGMSGQCASGLCDMGLCACDQDADCSGGQLCNTVANPNLCVNPGCGNFVLEANEGCDDGNMMAGDGCNAVCLLELGEMCTGSSKCASTFCDPAGNICACDENSDCPGVQLCNTVANPNLCVNPGCGNNVLESGEACDDGNTAGGDGCTSMCLREIGQPCTINTQCASSFCDVANNTCACDQDADCSGGQVCNTVASPNVCVNPGCGNFVVEAGEGCDDGNTTNGDGCNSTCLKEIGQACVGSVQCASQFCDTANNTCACDMNADCPMGQLCNTVANPNVCVNPGCGNFVVEAGEGCDDGNTTSGDGCNNTCLREIGQMCTTGTQCASQFCDPANNTCACDMDSDCPMGQNCNTTLNPNQCVPMGCGNGVLNAGEGCDDNNTTNGDGCNAQCLIELTFACGGNTACASQFCDPTNNTCRCDQDVDCPNGQLCNTVANPNACVVPGCGNNVLEVNEGCDDGNTMNGDGCNSMCLREIGQVCTISGQCASGFCDPANTTCQCDQDADCPMGQLCNTVATPNVCVNPGCGNFVVETGEGCDDGNTTSGDGCNSMCLREIGEMCTMGTQCASQFCDPANNTCACDQSADCSGGQLCNVVAAPNVCVNPGCANNVLEANEGCDDGNMTNGDGCNSACLLELGEACPVSNACASGFCDPANDTCACDQDADCSGGQLCNILASPNACVNPGCGNFVLEANEGCDDGNTTGGDGCNSTCLLEIGEACTAGNKCASQFCDNSDNTCACNEDADCAMNEECNQTLNPNECVPFGCGNGILSVGEGCDDGNLMNGDGCTSQCLLELGQACMASVSCESGFCDPTGNICACDQDADCSGGQLCNTSGDPNACVDPGCANGVLEMNEGCDDGNTAPGDGCGSTCLLEIGEPCTLSGTCESAACDPQSGTCECDDDADCPMGNVCDLNPDPNACIPGGCGNGVVETGEGCDDGNMMDGDGCTAACAKEIGQMCTDGTECDSGNCDGTTNFCVCEVNSDCGADEVCNTNADPNVCVTAGCGNSVLETGEGCDDGNTTDGDGCSAVCAKELGQMCTDGTECNSGNCDGTTNVCVCDIDEDCPMGQTCDTGATPHACVMEDGCRDDSECTGGLFCDEPSRQCVECTKDTECAGGLVCDEPSFTCVECVVDADCPDEGTCDAAKLVCIPAPVIVEGGGILCATSTVATNDNNWPFALLGLLALGMTRRRRR